MKRTSGYKLRQLPLCDWCFGEIDNGLKKFCSPACSEAATEWKNAAHWRKIGQDIAKRDVQRHYERNITDDIDNKHNL